MRAEGERVDGHWIQAQYEDRDWDQLMGWIVVCGCGEKFDHIAPEGARAAWQYHAQPPLARDPEWPAQEC